jgi:hypothetical protein
LDDFDARAYDPQLGRWHAPDPASQFASPYLAMGNRPVEGVDPDGRWFGWDDLAAAGIGFAAGYLTHGLSTGQWGKQALAAGGMGALSGWLAYNTGGMSAATSASGKALLGEYALNQVISLGSASVLPGYQHDFGGFSLGVSPSFSTSGFGLDFSVGAFVGDVHLSTGFGVGANTGTADLSKQYRAASKGTYKYASFGLGVMIDNAYYGGSYGLNGSTGPAGQGIGYFGLQIGDFGLRIDEDYFGDGGDRWKTGGGTATYRINRDVTLGFGLAMLTGQQNGFRPERAPTGKFITASGLETPGAFRGGAIYGGVVYKGRASFLGYNSDKILHGVQNFIHDKIVNTDYYFENLGLKPRLWSYFGSYSVNSLVY